jgi:hypothetical protein
MALSNIFREPRREITESAVGIGIVVLFLFLDSYFASWMQGLTVTSPGGRVPIGVCYLAGLLALIVVALFLGFTHFVGEEICDALAKRGLELRPKIRR